MYASEKLNGAIFTLLIVAVAAAALFSLPLGNNVPSRFSIHSNHMSPKSYSSYTDIPSSQARESDLLARKPPNGGPIQTTNIRGWDIKYRQYFSFIIPVQVAASVLEEFYNDCLRRITLKQSRNKPDPGNAFAFNLGSVFLAFRAADPNQSLTWFACEIIIDGLLEHARMGFTTQFKSEWFHPETNKLVYVSLSMLQRIGPGRVRGGS